MNCQLCSIESRKAICKHCIRRVKTWGRNGLLQLFSLAKESPDLDISFLVDFCEKYYLGTVKISHEKTSIMKTALKLLGYRGKVIGRHRKYSDYHHARLANISGNKRHQLKKSKCEMCGTSKGLRVHYIVPVSWGGVQFAPDRIYTVCKMCHGILHQRLKAVLTNDLKIRYFSAFSNEIIRLAESTIYEKKIYQRWA